MVTFTKATRRQQKVKIGIAGPSGSGKSKGALALAKALAPTGKIAAIDTENGSLSLYSDDVVFDTFELRPPYLSKKYIEAIEAAEEAGYEVLVIDSISHQWDGHGGILQRKEAADAVPGSNHFSNWEPFTKEHNAFRAKLLDARIHIIATMRSKQAYALKEAGSGRSGGRVEKLGLQPIQREGMEYEFTVTFDLAMDHHAGASKDRTGLFGGQRHDLLEPKIGKKLLHWLETAAPELPPTPPSASTQAPPAVVASGQPTQAAANGKKEMSAAMLSMLADGKMPIGHSKGTPIAKLEEKDLLSALTWCRETDGEKFAPLIVALQTEHQQRQGPLLPGLEPGDDNGQAHADPEPVAAAAEDPPADGLPF